MTGSGIDAYTVAHREDALDFMADYPGTASSAGTRARSRPSSLLQLAPDAAGTGGRGSYGHRHPGQEEVYFVISGTVTFKIDDEVFEAGPQTAIRIGGAAFAPSTTTPARRRSCSSSRP